MDLEGLLAGRVALLELLDDLRLARCGHDGRDHVLVRAEIVEDGARLDHARPPDQARHAVAALPVRVLLASERRRAPVGPAHGLGAVVGRVHDDRVVRDPEVVELLQDLADVRVVLDHPVGVDPEAGLALRAPLQVREDVHPRRVPPEEERLLGLVRLVDEAERPLGDLVVDRLHPLLGQRPGVLDLVVAGPRPPRAQHAARAEALLELRVLRIVGVLRLLLGVQVVEVAEELVEPVLGRQELVAVAEVVLPVLAGHVPERLEQLGERGILGFQSEVGPWQADLGQPGADRRLAGDERRAPGGTALLPVPVGEEPALTGEAVDVGRPVAHDTEVVGAEVVPADVVAPDDDDVRALLVSHDFSLPRVPLDKN